MDRMSLQVRLQKGMTFIELMIVLVIVAVTIAASAPPLRRLVYSNQVQIEVSRLMTAINLARSEAVKRNTPVSVCPSSMAITGEPTCSGIYADGWIVYSNPDRDGVLDETDVLIRIFHGLPAGYSLTNRLGTIDAKQRITYLADGSSGRNRTLLVCSPLGNTIVDRSVVMNIVGRPRVARDWGVCPPV